MKLEELADLSADRLEKMSDEELFKVLSPYFNVTRPEFVVKQVRSSAPSQPAVMLNPAKRAALAMLQEEGLDLDFLNKRRKR